MAHGKAPTGEDVQQAFTPIINIEKLLAFRERVLDKFGDGGGPMPPTLPPPPGSGGGGFALTFAQTEAGVRLAASLAQETERTSGRERLKLEDTLNSLAMDLLPPADVETAMRQVRRGELVKSKLAFQAVLENLADEARNAERRRDLALAEENEKRTLRNARARITLDMVGRDLGRAIIFALGGAGGGGE
jgi:hypothetical protein